jgi:hypothetical protein
MAGYLGRVGCHFWKCLEVSYEGGRSLMMLRRVPRSIETGCNARTAGR